MEGLSALSVDDVEVGVVQVEQTSGRHVVWDSRVIADAFTG